VEKRGFGLETCLTNRKLSRHQEWNDKFKQKGYHKAFPYGSAIRVAAKLDYYHSSASRKLKKVNQDKKLVYLEIQGGIPKQKQKFLLSSAW